VKAGTNAAYDLDDYLQKVRMPYVTALRETQNYNRAQVRGIGIHELPPYLASQDWEYWDPLVKWLNSQRSLPAH
jgi:chromosome partitioning protein